MYVSSEFPGVGIGKCFEGFRWFVVIDFIMQLKPPRAELSHASSTRDLELPTSPAAGLGSACSSYLWSCWLKKQASTRAFPLTGNFCSESTDWQMVPCLTFFPILNVEGSWGRLITVHRADKGPGSGGNSYPLECGQTLGRGQRVSVESPALQVHSKELGVGQKVRFLATT